MLIKRMFFRIFRQFLISQKLRGASVSQLKPKFQIPAQSDRPSFRYQ